MSDVVIRVENLGKRYRLGQARVARYTALRDVLAGAVRGFGRRLLRRDRSAAASLLEVGTGFNPELPFWGAPFLAVGPHTRGWLVL